MNIQGVQDLNRTITTMPSKCLSVEYRLNRYTLPMDYTGIKNSILLTLEACRQQI